MLETDRFISQQSINVDTTNVSYISVEISSYIVVLGNTLHNLNFTANTTIGNRNCGLVGLSTQTTETSKTNDDFYIDVKSKSHFGKVGIFIDFKKFDENAPLFVNFYDIHAPNAFGHIEL